MSEAGGTDTVMQRSVVFIPDDGSGGGDLDSAISLTPEGPWVISAGTGPDVNRVLVPYVAFDKIFKVEAGGSGDGGEGEDKKLSKNGRIEWSWGANGESVITLQNQTIVDVEPVSYGTVVKTDKHDNVSTENRVTEYRLYFADFRAGLQPPRGGRMFNGILNPDPSRKVSTPGVTDPDPKTNQELISICLKKMGIDSEGPSTANLYYPPTNLEWLGAHPMEELDKLLKGCQHVFCPVDDDEKKVQQIGVGDDLFIPDNQALPVLDIKGIDRRGKTIIVTSAPTAQIDTWTWSGSGTTSTSFYPTWDFVVRTELNPDKWDKLSNYPAFADPVSAINSDYAGKDTSSIEVINFDTEAYFFLRLDPDRYDPQHCPVRWFTLTDPTIGDKGVTCKSSGIKVVTKGAVQQIDGTWATASPTGEIRVVSLQSGNRICAATRVAKLLVSPASELDGNLQAATCNLDFGVSYSVEAWDKDRKEKKYFRCGFRKNLDALEELDDDEVLDLLDGKQSDDDDVIVLHMPDLMYVVVNGGPSGDGTDEALHTQLKDKAKARVQAIFDATSTVTKRRATGFVAAEISGKVSKITYNYADCTTDFELNTWAMPAAAVTFNNRPDPTSTQGASDAGVAPQLFSNGSKASQASILVNPQPPPPSPASTRGTYQYTVQMMVADNVSGWDYPRAHEP